MTKSVVAIEGQSNLYVHGIAHEGASNFEGENDIRYGLNDETIAIYGEGFGGHTDDWGGLGMFPDKDD